MRERETFISLIICYVLIDQRPHAVGKKPGLAQRRAAPRAAGTLVLQCLTVRPQARGGDTVCSWGRGQGCMACPVYDPGAALRDRKAIAGQPPRERKLLLCIWRG